jgi:small-conductance mechanosensitive channel
VGVAYDSDAHKAHAVLSEIARSHPMVLKNPEPFVQFTNFGPAALEFEIRVFLADITNSGTVQNDIRFAILDAFDREGIAIPSTVRAVMEKKPALEPWPTDDDRIEVEAAEQEEAKAEAARQQAKSRRKGRKPDPN